LYYYISINFGSILQQFLENPIFSIQFNFSVFVFAILSNLLGWKIGLLGGIIGEFLYHLSYFPDNSVYFEWVILVGVMGILFGIYKYKPLKYQEGTTKIFSNFLIFIASSFILLILTTFLATINSNLDLELILINFGFKLFMDIIISVVFITPILIFIIDKIFSSNEREIYNALLTHHDYSNADHTFMIKFGRTEVYFCSRCSGMIISIVFSSFLVILYENITNTPFSQEIALYSCIILPIPGLIDWCTQKLKYRKSTTNKRLFTGFLLGMSLYLLAYTRDYILIMTIIIIIYFSIFFLVFYIGQKKEIKSIQNSLDQVSS